MPQPKIKEEERIERIIRGLVKFPENKRCINCNSLGPQYVCTTFWTFVCTNCSGVHREFTHRVKSVSMAKFSADEVAALQAGGNEQARKIYFKTWDPQRNSFPDGSNLQKLRDFIRHVYVDGKYTGERKNDRISADKADHCSEQRSCEKSSQVARNNFFERLSSETANKTRRNDLHDRRSFENISPMLRYYFDERNSPRYKQEKLKSASRRRRPPNFEIVDDRFREDGERNARPFESKRYLDADSRERSNSPVSQNGRSKTCPPPVNPVKDILADKVPPPKLREPPKADEVKNIECSNQVQKEAGSASAESIAKGKTNVVSTCNLIDFDGNPQPPATTAVVQTQQHASSTDARKSLAPTSVDEKPSNPPNVNPMELLLFELAGPAVAPSVSTSEQPPGAESSSAATEGSLNVTSGPTTNASLDSNYVGTTKASTIQNSPALPQVMGDTIVTVSHAQQLPAVNQNQSFATSTGSGSSASPQTSSCVQCPLNQPLSLELAHNKGPSTLVSSEQSLQGAQNLAQDRSSGNETSLIGRQELPEDIFTSSHPPFTAAVPSWQFCPPYGTGYGMQYRTTSMAPHDSVRSTNPFDLGDDGHGHNVQAVAFNSMSTLQGTLPNTLVSPVPWPQVQGFPYASAGNSQGMSYGMMIPHGAYMGQQLSDNRMPTKPQGVNNAGANSDAFGSLNPIQHASRLSSAPPGVGSNAYPTRKNPFG
ncbi:hypothetical protein M9H77_19260 [Catharanthus roseus]|uniref:Uncharacterized protein n=1 Tax=Catharanthus roseus TaxID=4058 RepID=A0ACC0B9T2_CATRO|nr:hypothetical protein M9H77_19260 [Catharanthus roseus]